MADLEELDLQLLLVFEAIYLERSVTAAGQRLGRTQPAVSNALARLRSTLGDELFVRQGPSMQPTPLAERLAPVLLETLERLRTAFRRLSDFDPQTAEEEVRLGMTDYGTALFLPR